MELRILNSGPFGVNCYLISNGDRAVVIDPGVPGQQILKILAEKGQRLCGILLTHGHVDHLAFADELPEKVPLYVHRADMPALTDPKRNVSTLFGFALTVQRVAQPIVGGDVLDLAGLQIEVIDTPGHTPGGVCYKIGRDIFCGDTVFASGRGRTDLPGGSEERLMESIRQLLEQNPDARLYPGHGGGTTCAQERAYYEE